jgi:hypothetical protein
MTNQNAWIRLALNTAADSVATWPNWTNPAHGAETIRRMGITSDLILASSGLVSTKSYWILMRSSSPRTTKEPRYYSALRFGRLAVESVCRTSPGFRI